ncbi:MULTISPECIES: flavin reductase family protein [Paraburkholderia]|uniref:flavin reductase family protein n=1 Tax=Paraburkholderia TaxID=1822464 RepID=UPI0013A6D187|nr:MULTISPECIES: flavin reductase family protein [Paraburkholderia]MDH6147552.1 flavin reductase (DIM6/NTAB) family NADH-FMN oxidoreductase RutF [Paraburkholderia sp. WSM4179]
MTTEAHPPLQGQSNMDLFRQLSNAWPRGVAVVTTIDVSGSPAGLTMRAVSPVSSDPLRFMICAGEQSRSLKAILASQVFCINYLTADQQTLSDQFASRIDDKFANVKTRRLNSGCLAIEGAAAVIECRVAHAISSGDHRLLIGDVTAAEVHDGDPLVIFGAGYRRLAAA